MHRERTRRIPLRISVTVHPPEGREIQGWAKNLSVSGIYVETHRQLAVGTLCVLRMTLPQGQTFFPEGSPDEQFQRQRRRR